MAKSKPATLNVDLNLDDQTASDAVTIDFSTVPDARQPLPEGDYFAEIVKSEMKRSQAGFPKVALRWKVLDGEQKDRLIFQDISLKASALQYSRADLEMLGVDMSGQVTLNPVEFVGEQRYLKVGIEVSTNPKYGDRNRVAKIYGEDYVSDLDAVM